jgi:hypothetical protein
MPSTVRFDTIFDELEQAAPLGMDGPSRITSGVDRAVRLDHGLVRGQKILARARVARTLLGLAAPVDGPVRVRLEFRWDDVTDEWGKRDSVPKSKVRVVPWSVAGHPGAPIEIKRGRSAAGEVLVPPGAVPPGGLLLLEFGAAASLGQYAHGLALLVVTVTAA